MKTTAIVGVAAAAIGLLVGSQLPKLELRAMQSLQERQKIERPLKNISKTLINSQKNVGLIPWFLIEIQIYEKEVKKEMVVL